jgi:carboxypeptidase C (cathepsin A)
MLTSSRFAAVVSLLTVAAASAGAQGRRAEAAGAPPQGQGRSENMTTTTTTTTGPRGGGGGGAESDRRVPVIPADSVTEGTVALAGGKTVNYRAVAGFVVVGATDPQDAQIGNDGKYLPEAPISLPATPDDQPATARMFYTAYFAQGGPSASRPITFLYNGGPGSPTMYLHMGSFGPKRLVTPDTQHQEAAPYSIVSNQYSLLDVSDLVFIDAPGTGYSRIMGRNAGPSFYGVDPDGHAFDRFIRRFLSKYNRWNSPKFLFGESYGTTRDAVLVNDLAGSGVDMNGVVFLSQILNFANSADGSDGSPGNENGFFLALPSMAATAWYHHKVPNQPAQLEPWIHEVEGFALGDYASALLQGAMLTPEKKAAVAAKLESYTGIPASLWLKANLRLTGGEFSKHLQESAGITTGRLDSRYEGPDMDPLGRDAAGDPFSSATTAAFLGAMNTYAHNDLKFGESMTYKPSAREPGVFNWNMSHSTGGRGGGGGGGSEAATLNVSNDLAMTLKRNPRMHVLLMGGYFDLGTLYFGATYEMKHLPIPDALQKNIDYKFFQTGHMVYVNEEALHQLHDRTAEFIRANEKPAM